MYVDEGEAGLRRRVDEARGYADQIRSLSPNLADALRREADLIERAMPGLNKQGIASATGMIHGLTYAAAVLLEQSASESKASKDRK